MGRRPPPPGAPLSPAPAERAWVLLRGGDARRAVEVVEEALSTAPRDRELRIVYAAALGRFGLHWDAVDVAQSLVDEAPDAWWSHAAHARALVDLGHPREGRDAARRAVAAGPDEAGAWTALADAEANAGRRRKAWKAAERALALDPESVEEPFLRRVARQWPAPLRRLEARLGRLLDTGTGDRAG